MPPSFSGCTDLGQRIISLDIRVARSPYLSTTRPRMLDVHSRDDRVPLVLFGGRKSSPALVQLVWAYLRRDPLVANRRSACSHLSLSEPCFPRLVLLFSEVFSNCDTSLLVLEHVRHLPVLQTADIRSAQGLPQVPEDVICC